VHRARVAASFHSINALRKMRAGPTRSVPPFASQTDVELTATDDGKWQHYRTITINPRSAAARNLGGIVSGEGEAISADTHHHQPKLK